MSPHLEDLSCEAVVDELEPFVDGDLPAVEVAAVERHLESCWTCRAELRMARRIRDDLRALPRLDAPASVIDAVVERARRQGPAAVPSRGPRLRPSPVWALAAALVLAAVLAPILIAPRPPGAVARVEVEAPEDPLRVSRAISPDSVDVARAAEEARVALAYVSQVTRRTGLEIRDELIVERLVLPATEGLSSLRSAPGGGARGEGNET